MFNGKRLRLGLCCIFRGADINFMSRQAGYILRLTRDQQLDRLSTTILHNASSLLRALEYCAAHAIGCFRVNSRFWPLKSHPGVKYTLEELPDHQLISELLDASRSFARNRNVRLTLHPDQFTLLSSPVEHVHEQSLAELRYHAELADHIGADVIMLHGGGAYGDKASTLKRLSTVLLHLPAALRSRLALENDDRIYSPGDLLPLCEHTGIPLVYDVHHHRILQDELTVEEATRRSIATWNREPLFHLSSPRDGWQARDLRPHSDFIEPSDLPDCWRELEVTVEVEAKAKELAVEKLQRHLAIRQQSASGRRGSPPRSLTRSVGNL